MVNMYLPIRHRFDLLANDEPLSAITEKSFERTNEKNNPGGQFVTGEASEKTKSLSNIFCDGEIVKLELGEVHEGLEGIRVVGEGVVVAGNGLDPDGGDETQPFGGAGNRGGSGIENHFREKE